MPFSNYNSSAVKWTGSGKCHIQLAIRKTGDGRYIATQLNVCPWALLICHSKCDSDVKLVMFWRFKQLHNFVRTVQWHEMDTFKFYALIINNTFLQNQNYCRFNIYIYIADVFLHSSYKKSWPIHSRFCLPKKYLRAYYISRRKCGNGTHFLDTDTSSNSL
jgi:hypothetical protein